MRCGQLRFEPTTRPSSFRSAPAASKQRTSRSTLTVESPDSIFATRDWLEPTRRASSACVQCCASRNCRRRRAKASLISTNSASPAVNFRNSRVSLTLQPAASSLRLFCAFTTQSPLPPVDSVEVSSAPPPPRASAWLESSSETPQESQPHPRQRGTESAKSRPRHQLATRGSSGRPSASLGNSACSRPHHPEADEEESQPRSAPAERRVVF